MAKRPISEIQLPSCICVHADSTFLADAIHAVKHAGPVYVFVSQSAWHGPAGNWQDSVEIAEVAGAIVAVGDWPGESLHRTAALAEMKRLGFRHILIPDSDEILEPGLIETLKKIATEDLADAVRCRMLTYWKDAWHQVQPPEELAPIIMLNAQKCEHDRIREYSAERALTLGFEYPPMHHLSYAGPNDRIRRKIETWGHRHEVGQDWYQRVWLGWEADPTIRNLHPTHPQCYGSIEAQEPPALLTHLPRWRDDVVEKPDRWPTISVVIPLHGGSEEIRLCLASLEKIKDLLHEVIVVDDASPDDAPTVARTFGFVRVLPAFEVIDGGGTEPPPAPNNGGNGKNRKPSLGRLRIAQHAAATALSKLPGASQGFAATCNRGFAASTGEVILCLNSDTIVPRAGLVRLIEALNESLSIAAAGPMSNNVGYYQRLDATYRRLDNLDAFADDLALSLRENRDVEMLVGFALAIRRTVLEEIGGFDERFGAGEFEDTDMCYRILRAGMRLRLASRAYVHHFGSRTIQHVVPDLGALMKRNEALYRRKWQWDLDIRYASHLPGLDVTSGLVKFDESRHPDKVEARLAKLRKQANISLCMIVRNEERSLDACLESSKRFFNQIVVVDTGSTDRTIEIAKAHGGEVHEMVWPDSFAGARNESMKHAKGDWICWIDADDTVPYETGMAILEAALSGLAEAFVIPVQFLEDGFPRGTSVDHVKLFKNLPGLKWTRRIHEQILGALSERGIVPARLPVSVLHSHYDQSAEGQARKLARDRHLLALESADNPEDPYTLFCLGMTEGHAKEYGLAIDYLTRALETATPQMTHTRKIYALLAIYLRDSGNPEKAMEILNAGLAHYPDDAELHFHAAAILMMKGEPKAAYDHLLSYGEEVTGHYSSIDKGILTYRRWHLLGELSAELGNNQEALKWFLTCLEREPWFANAQVGLFDASIKVGDLHHARIALDALLLALGPVRVWVEREARFAEAIGGPGNVLPTLTNLTSRFPASAAVHLALSEELLKRGDTSGALSRLAELDRAGVAEAAACMSTVFEQHGDLPRARLYAYRAAELRPDDPTTQERLAALRPAVDRLPASVLEADEARRLLTGPQAGKLGPPTCRYSIVIVTYQSERWIGDCLKSVLPTLSEQDEVIVVDNASSDGTASVIKATAVARNPRPGGVPHNSPAVDPGSEAYENPHPGGVPDNSPAVAPATPGPRRSLLRPREPGAANVCVVRNKENRGYAPAANQGIRKSHGEYIVLLNPDTTVHPCWLEAMAKDLAHGWTAVGPVSDAITGDQFIGHYLPPGAAPDVEGIGNLVAARFRGHAVETKFLVGMCLMIPRSVLDEIGLLDDELVLGADDLDLSLRVRLRGLKLGVALDAFVHHAEHASFDARPREETAALIAQSDARLTRKIRRYFGDDNVLTSQTLFGCEIFTEALKRSKVI